MKVVVSRRQPCKHGFCMEVRRELNTYADSLHRRGECRLQSAPQGPLGNCHSGWNRRSISHGSRWSLGHGYPWWYVLKTMALDLHWRWCCSAIANKSTLHCVEPHKTTWLLRHAEVSIFQQCGGVLQYVGCCGELGMLMSNDVGDEPFSCVFGSGFDLAHFYSLPTLWYNYISKN